MLEGKNVSSIEHGTEGRLIVSLPTGCKASSQKVCQVSSTEAEDVIWVVLVHPLTLGWSSSHASLICLEWPKSNINDRIRLKRKKAPTLSIWGKQKHSRVGLLYIQKTKQNKTGTTLIFWGLWLHTSKWDRLWSHTGKWNCVLWDLTHRRDLWQPYFRANLLVKSEETHWR